MSISRVNNLLIAAIVAINVFVIALPLYPALSFWWATHVQHRQPHFASSKMNQNPVPAGERLIIPKLLLDEQVYEGPDVITANKGIWRYPQASMPDKGGNTVLIGHRFTYLGPAVFYHLDLLSPGDPITIFWNGRKYSYVVSQIKVIKPSDTSIFWPTNDSRLTLYTCTPIWSTKNRLVVIAERTNQ